MRSAAIVSLVLVACGAGQTSAQGAGATDASSDGPGASTSSGSGGGGTQDSGTTTGQDSGDMSMQEGGTTGDDGGGAGSDAKYASDGPVPYTVSHLTLSNAGRSWGESIYLPTTPGLHPVVTVNSGTQQVNAAYAIYGKRLASYGIIALTQDDEGALAPTPNVVADLEYVITTYVPANLAASADMTRVGLSGHSRGGKATLLAAEGALMGKVKAWFGLDPVDVDFTGSPSALPDIGTIGIPLGFAGATVSSNCSPADANYQVYYAAASPPAVAVSIEGAGHFDFLDQSQAIAESYCTPEGTVDPTLALDTAAHYLMAFFARELLGDSSVGAAFGGAGAQADIAAGIIAVVSK
jgi:hypothetical protein